MNLNELLEIGGGALLFIAAIGVLVGNVYYVLRSKTSKLQKEQIEQLTKDFSNCESQHKESLKLIHTLQGRVEELRGIPLMEIRDGIKSISATNGKILETLKISAVALKQDTKRARVAAEGVRYDLGKSE